jgi:hypothetical protein
VCLYGELVAAECSRACLQHQVEGVLGVNSKTTKLGAVYIAGLWDRARLAAIAVEREAS